MTWMTIVGILSAVLATIALAWAWQQGLLREIWNMWPLALLLVFHALGSVLDVVSYGMIFLWKCRYVLGIMAALTGVIATICYSLTILYGCLN